MQVTEINNELRQNLLGQLPLSGHAYPERSYDPGHQQDRTEDGHTRRGALHRPDRRGWLQALPGQSSIKGAERQTPSSLSLNSILCSSVSTSTTTCCTLKRSKHSNQSLSISCSTNTGSATVRSSAVRYQDS